MKYNILPVFIPFSGCKNICLFCNQEHITGENKRDVVKNVDEQLQYYLNKKCKMDRDSSLWRHIYRLRQIDSKANIKGYCRKNF